MFRQRHSELAEKLMPKWREVIKAIPGGKMKIATLFSGRLDGFATVGERFLAATELLARADSDPLVQSHWEKRRKGGKLQSWGDIENVIGSTHLQVVLLAIHALIVSPPCKDWSMAGMLLRSKSRSGCWLLDWTRVLKMGRPPLLLMEFIYSEEDPAFQEALKELKAKLEVEYDYIVAEPSECVVNAAEVGGEDRVRLILPARAVEVHGTNPVGIARLPAGVTHTQAVMADWLVPAAARGSIQKYSGPVRWLQSEQALQSRKSARGSFQVTLGAVRQGGLGHRVMSPYHAWPTIRATTLDNRYRQPMGPTEGFQEPVTGKIVLPEREEIMRIRGYPAQVATTNGKAWSWQTTASFAGRGVGAEHAVVGIVSLVRLLQGCNLKKGPTEHQQGQADTAPPRRRVVRMRGVTATNGQRSRSLEPGYSSGGSGGSQASVRTDLSMDGRDHVQRVELSQADWQALKIHERSLVAEGWPRYTVPFLSPLRYKIIAVRGIQMAGESSQRVKQEMREATQSGGTVCVEAAPLEGESVAVVAPQRRETPARDDKYKDLADRLKLEADDVTRYMVGKKPAVMQLLSKVTFSESTPGEHEQDGAQEEYFTGQGMAMMPDLNHVADSAALEPPETAEEWTGGRVTIRDLIKRKDRKKIAKFMNDAHTCAKIAWDHCIALRTNAAAKLGRFPRVRPVIITDIDEKYRDFKWDTSNPEKCVPIHRIHKFQPKLKGTEFGKVCRKHRLRDHRLISLVKHGVTSLAETRPYSVVLNFNYASLAQYYDQVFAKVQQELKADELLELIVKKPERGFNADNIVIPFVPMCSDSTGTATRRTDENNPKKARRTTGKNSPESVPEYGLNTHANVAENWAKLRLPTVKTHITCAAILFVPAKMIKEELVILASDFSSFYCQFHNRVDELVHSVFHLVGQDEVMRWLTSKVMQFGGSFGPAIGQGYMECLCEIARQIFDKEEALKLPNLMSRFPAFSTWVDGRRDLAKSLVDLELERMPDRQEKFALRSEQSWYEARLEQVTREQTRLYSLCGYIDDKHGCAVGKMRGFRLLVTVLQLGIDMGAAFKPEKIGFGHRLQELGFIQDVKRMVLVIPERKRAVMIAALEQLLAAKTAGREDFKSIVHTLVSFTCVIKEGRVKLNRMFRLQSARWGLASSRRGNRIILGDAAKEDIRWWAQELKTASGCEMMVPRERIHPTRSWESDACREIGSPSGVAGFLPYRHGYFWRETFSPFVVQWLHITQLEFYGTLQNAAVFGPIVRDKQMFDDCDNDGVCGVIKSQTTSDPVMSEMLVSRNEFLAEHNIETVARHFPGWMNVVTDALSRGNMDVFREAVTQRGYNIDEIEEILPNKSLTSLLHKLACMVRDHKSA